MVLSVGDTVNEGTFGYVPYTPELDDLSACGVPAKLSTNEWKGKKIVLIGVPGAFTPTCSVNHMPPFVEKVDEIKAKGVDQVYVVSSNDLFVMSAWGRSFKAKDSIVAISDATYAWLEPAGLVQDLSHVGFGKRAKRFAMILDDNKVTYLGIEDGGDVGVSGAPAVLAKL